MARNTDRIDRSAEMHSQLEAAIAELVSGDDWAAMLATAAKFHNYSANNLLLILSQMPTASRVCGYKTWQSLGRQVRKGESGIAILAPVGGPCRDCGGTGGARIDGVWMTCGRCFGSGRWQNFKAAYVFDVSQTDGDPLPAEIRPTLLEGEAPDGLWASLASQVEAAGYELVRGACDGANGRTEPGARTVTVRDDVDDAQACKTLAHELAHIVLGHTDDLAAYTGCRGRCEVEAESVAYIVTGAHGMSTDGYSLPYVATWAAGDVKVVRQTADAVVKASRAILDAIDAACELVAA